MADCCRGHRKSPFTPFCPPWQHHMRNPTLERSSRSHPLLSARPPAPLRCVGVAFWQQAMSVVGGSGSGGRTRITRSSGESAGVECSTTLRECDSRPGSSCYIPPTKTFRTCRWTGFEIVPLGSGGDSASRTAKTGAHRSPETFRTTDTVVLGKAPRFCTSDVQNRPRSSYDRGFAFGQGGSPH